ncbi:MAG: mechanosensitive ion channel family protein [Methylococcaceae bacterium]|nr:mechanosensitive ion channel family protein [Methylococcaceae bacterium]
MRCLFHALLIALLITSFNARAVSATAVSAGGEEIGAPMAPVEVDGATLFHVVGIKAFPAEKRARLVADRIRDAASNPTFLETPVQIVDATDRSKIIMGDHLLISVFDAEAAIEGVSRQILAEVYQAKIWEAIQAYRRDRSPDRLIRAATYAFGASLGLLAALWLGWRVYRRIDTGMEHRFRSKIHGLEIQSFEIVRAERIWAVLRGLSRWSWIVLMLLLAYLYLNFVLGLFPWTRAFAGYLFGLLVNPLRKMGTALIDIVPDLVFIAILFVITRYVLKVTRLYFSGIADGTVALHGFEPDWAWPTYRILRLLIVIFALVVAYPYIPGSETNAFKGISIFLGVLFSLGSSSVIANIIAGYTMTYRRAFRIGDRVQIGEHLGDVVETRLLVTHLRTPKNEDIVVPNSVILSSEVINYSTHARQQGLILHTTIGIGYETPWRQVEAMLIEAARRTPGLLQQPPPFVLQKSLGDFAVNYEINVYCDQPSAMTRLYTALHQNILDLFNEYGVQIMTPAYEGDPGQPKVVPKDQWFAAPAAPTEPESHR